MKNNRKLSLLLLFAMGLNVLNVGSLNLNSNTHITYANDTTPESSFDFDSTTKTLKKFKGTETVVVIPETISGVKVEKIGNKAFFKSGVTSVKLNEGLVEIEDNAFSASSNLAEVTFPSTLKKIGKFAFLKTKISTLNLNEGLEFIGSRAFSNCSSLETVIVPNSLTQISDLAFEKTKVSGEFVLGENLGHVGHKIFDKNTTPILVSIKDGTGSKLFLHDELFLINQDSLKVPQNREVMLFARAFLKEGNIKLDCGELEVNSNESNSDIVNKINSAVKLTSGFAIVDKKGDMSKDVYVETAIDWNLDNVDLSKEEVTVFGNFKPIPDEKYDGSGQSKDVVESNLSRLKPELKLKVKLVKEDWKEEDFTFKEVEEKKISSNNYFAVTGFSESGLKKLKTNKDLVIPETAHVLVDGKLVEKDITGIGKHAFKNSGLNSVKFSVPNGYKEYIIDTNAFSNNNLTEINIPEGVKIIESYAFKDNKITSLNLPGTVAKLGNESFADNKISELVISDDVERFQFDSFSFSHNKLKEVNLPYSVFKILDNVFFQNEFGKVKLYTRNPQHFDVSTYIRPISDYHELILVSEDVDREELYKKIKFAKTLDPEEFIKESFDKFTKVLDEVKKVFENTKSTQKNINDAIVKLEESIDALESVGVNKKAINKNIARIEHLNPDLYTKESFDNLMNTVNSAKEKLNSKDLTQIDVDKLLSDILNMESKLVISDNYKYNVSDFNFDGGKILGFTESGKEKFKLNKNLVIPATNKDGVPVTEIGNSAFEYTGKDYIYRTDTAYSPNGLDSVEIPNTVVKIGDNAFRFNKIKEVVLPEGLKEIGTSAFNGNQLVEAIIPDSVETIGDGAFSLNNIVNAKLSKNMKAVPKGIFSRNIKLDKVEIPEGVEVIEQSAFVGCPITEINIPNTVKEVKYKAFSSHRISTLNIPSSVEIIDRMAFESNKKFRYLKTVNLEEGLKEIRSNAFKSCLIEEITIPNSLEVLTPDAFNDNLNANKDVIKTKVYTYNPKHVEMFKSDKYELILLKTDIEKLKAELGLSENLLNDEKYKALNSELKTEFEKYINAAKAILENPTSQKEVDKLTEKLMDLRKKLNDLKDKVVIDNNDVDNGNTGVVDTTKPVEFISEDKVVKVESKDLKTGLKLVVEKVKNTLFKDLDLDIYDIKFVDENGNTVKVDSGSHKVTIKKSKNNNVSNVYYIDEDNNKESLAFVENGDYVTFTTKHFSKYSIEYKKSVAVGSNKVENSKKVVLPTTAVANTNLVNLVLCILSISTAMILRKKSMK